uniref:Alpha-macroglobulin receptor-binding domain-containing protein n=1 Tax=Erpetoichthys calabaricus TaxID=27687 RepID=A0A8C4SSV0_ERPCA
KAFVMKSFGSARRFIFIDPAHISDAKKWLGKHQLENGCFQNVGKLFHSGMKGGINDEISLTAYITTALLELETPLSILFFHKTHIITSSIVKYFADGFLHWERSGSGEKINSVQVEMTSYVLLSLFSGPPLPQFDLTYASSIVQWLVRQQNSYGGFSSTQDTVVALQSLALYAAQTYKPDGSSTVTISSSQGFQAQFQLDQSNRLLYQERTLPEIPGTYSVQAEGDVCSFVQVSVFNLLHIFSFVIFVLIFCCVRTCTFLLCFFQLVQRKPLTLHFTIQEEIAVKNLKPATVRIYDYYQTNDHAEAEYRSPCTTGIVFFNISVCLIRLFSNNSINFTF